MALKFVWKLVNTRCIQNGVVCVEVDQGITRSKSDIVVIIYDILLCVNGF